MTVGRTLAGQAFIGPTLWINDALVSAADAAISPFDHAITVGDGVFETLQVDADQPFAMARHLRRLHASASVLSIPVPAETMIRTAAAAVIDANPGADRLRITLSSGEGPLGSGRPETANGPTLIIAVSAGSPHPPAADVLVVPYTRNERSAIAGVKSTSYAENVVALAEAKANGCHEAIFANTQGDLCEGTGSNVFVVLDGALLTPPLTSGCLAGITRELILEITDAREAALPIDALAESEEAFLTSSLRLVQPIALVDGVALPRSPGPRTVAASQAFAKLQATTFEP